MNPHIIEIHVEGGVVHDVRNIPHNTVVRIIDFDTEGVEEERLSKRENGDEVVINEHWSNDLLLILPCPKPNTSPAPAAEKA